MSERPGYIPIWQWGSERISVSSLYITAGPPSQKDPPHFFLNMNGKMRTEEMGEGPEQAERARHSSTKSHGAPDTKERQPFCLSAEMFSQGYKNVNGN